MAEHEERYVFMEGKEPLLLDLEDIYVHVHTPFPDGNYLTPFPINVEEARQMGFGIEYIVWYRPYETARSLPCLMFYTSWEINHKVLCEMDAKRKRLKRVERCLLPDGKGAFMRCPEGKDCTECPRAGSFKHGTENFLSLDALLEESGRDNAPQYQLRCSRNTEDDAAALAVMDELIRFLDDYDERYADILQMLFNRNSKAEISRELGMSWNRIDRMVRRMRKLVQEYLRDM